MIIRAPAVQSSCACVAGAFSAMFADDGSAGDITVLRPIPFPVRADRIAPNGSNQHNFNQRA